MPTLSKLYTMQEAAHHNTKDDCWIVVHNKVYDVTSYLDDHPGGDDVVLAATGNSFLAVSLYIIYLSWNFPAQVYYNP
ncbi:hypothetical protein CISIN_1g041866mg, partial [Citrus sinensis]